MSTRLLLLLACVVCAASLQADFVGHVEATVHGGNGHGLEGVSVSAKFDPNWGWKTEAERDKYIRDYGPFPDVTATGETITDADGKFKLSVSVKVSGDGDLPDTSIRVNNSYIKVDFVRVILTLTKDGYREIALSTMVRDGNDDNQNNWRLRMSRPNSFEARLVHMDSRKPVGNAEVLVIGQRLGSNDPLVVTTDANGALKLDDEQCPPGRLQLLMLEDGLAFAPVSTVWRGINIQEGENDGGTLVVVPGGSIKFHCKHAETGNDLPVRYNFASTDPQARFDFRMNDHVTGETLIKGIPEGTYNLSVSVWNDFKFWPLLTEGIEVKTDQVTDVGELKIEPHQSIEVFAVSGEGAGIQAYNVTAEQISGYRAEQNNQWRDRNKEPQPWRVHASCTAEKNKIERLARGRWKITVNADGYTPGTVEVDVPATDPIFVKLQQGGGLHVSVDESDFQWDVRFGSIVAISADAPAWKELKGLSGTDILKMVSSVDSTGVFIQQDRYDNINTFNALPPGTYTIIGGSGDMNFGTARTMRADDVMIRKGETTKLVMTKSPGQLTVNALNGAKPFAGELMFLVPPERFNQKEAPKTISVTADANGVAKFDNVPAETYDLLTKRQYDWINSSSKGRWGTGRSLPNGVAPTIILGSGDRVEVTVDIHQPHFTWVSVKLNRAKSVHAVEVGLSDFNGRVGLNNITPVASGDLYEFGMLGKGTYEFHLKVATGGKPGYQLLRMLEVNQSGEQEFEVDLDVGTLEVKVKPPKGFDEREVTVYLEQAHDMAWASNNSPGAGGRTNEKGAITFENVPEGAYRVVAWASKDRGSITFITSEEVELKGKDKVSLKFDERIGELHLQLDGGRGFNFEDSMRVELLDGDKPAEMGNPRSVFRQNSGVTLAAVAKGKYTLRISAPGFEPYTQEDVKIETGRRTQLSVKLEKMCHVTVKLHGQHAKTLRLTDPEIEYLDASGNAIDVGDVRARDTMSLYTGNDGYASYEERSDAQLHLTHVPATCTRIRFKIAGIKTVTVDVKPEKDKRTTVEATVEAE